MRKEFTKAVKREALIRSGKLCEAWGADYGLNNMMRCNAPLSQGLEFDHYDAIRNDDNSLENCRAVCIPCHRFKTPNDTTKHAKVKRMSDKHNGIRKTKSKWPSRKMGKANYSNVKYINGDME
jgi:hypothetical protein